MNSKTEKREWVPGGGPSSSQSLGLCWDFENALQEILSASRRQNQQPRPLVILSG